MAVLSVYCVWCAEHEFKVDDFTLEAKQSHKHYCGVDLHTGSSRSTGDRGGARP